MRKGRGKPVFQEGGFVFDDLDLSSLSPRLEVLIRAVEAANNCVVLADPRADDVPLVYVNEGFCRISGYSPREVLGQNCRLLQSAPDGVKVRDVGHFDEARQNRELEVLRRALSRHEPAVTLLRNFTKDGRGFWNEFYTTPVMNDGECIAIIGVQNDVTARVEAQHRLVTVQQMERAALARELHDTVAQDLQALTLRTEIIAAEAGELSPEQLVQDLGIIRDAARRAASEARQIAHQLLPADHNQNLIEDLSEIARRSSDVWSINCRFDWSGDLIAVTREGRLHLTRIVQEAIANAVKHGQARQVDIKLDVVDGSPSAERSSDQAESFVLRIRNDGREIRHAEAYTHNNDDETGTGIGIGIKSMKTRAALLGGKLYLDNIESGVEVRVEVDALQNGRSLAAQSTSELNRELNTQQPNCRLPNDQN